MSQSSSNVKIVPLFRQYLYWLAFAATVAIASPFTYADETSQTAELNDEPRDSAEVTADQLAGQWDLILTNIVRDGLVDYSRASKSKPFSDYIEQLQAFDASKLSEARARKAHLINLYNALTVDLIVKNYPVSSIKRIGGWFRSPWELTVTVVNGQEATLNTIEHGMLRPMGDPRIHYAINCASFSCPKLRSEAYRADRIDEQLDEQRSEFLASSRGVQFDGRKLKISKIFNWFDEDWGGSDGVLAMLKRYHPLGEQFTKINSYLQYDWSLNEAEPAASDIIR